MPGYSLRCPSGAGFCAEYQAVYDAMTTPPDTDIAIQQNLMVETLIAGGIWNKLDIFYLFAQQYNTGGEALINWINPGTFDATEIPNGGALIFTSLEGLKGDSNAYLDTNWIASINAINFSQNNAHAGCYLIQLDSGTGSKSAFGWRDDVVGTRCYIYPNYNGSSGYHCVNNNAADTCAVCAPGVIMTSRYNNANYLFTNNKVDDPVDNRPSASLGSIKCYIFCYNDDVGGATGIIDGQISAFWLSSYLDSTKRGIVTDAIEAVMDYNGKGVI